MIDSQGVREATQYPNYTLFFYIYKSNKKHILA